MITDFEVTRQCEIFRNLPNDKKFHISDDLLFDCVGLGCGNIHSSDRVQGFNFGKGDGYALLTYFAASALNFRRFPFCEDRVYAGYIGDKLQIANTLSKLSESRINCIVEEVRALYEHTQAALSEHGLKEVQLRREIKHQSQHLSIREASGSYAENLVMLKESCDILQKADFEIEMDTLNSFGDEGAYFSEVALELSIPAKDILYCSALVGNRDGHQPTMESGEWVVINRSPTGVVNLPVSSLVVRRDMWKRTKPISHDEAEKFIESYRPIVFRPFLKEERFYRSYGYRPSVRSVIANQLLKWVLRCA